MRVKYLVQGYNKSVLIWESNLHPSGTSPVPLPWYYPVLSTITVGSTSTQQHLKGLKLWPPFRFFLWMAFSQDVEQHSSPRHSLSLAKTTWHHNTQQAVSRCLSATRRRRKKEIIIGPDLVRFAPAFCWPNADTLRRPSGASRESKGPCGKLQRISECASFIFLSLGGSERSSATLI